MRNFVVASSLHSERAIWKKKMKGSLRNIGGLFLPDKIQQHCKIHAMHFSGGCYSRRGSHSRRTDWNHMGQTRTWRRALIDHVEPRPCENWRAIKGNRDACIDPRWKDLHNEACTAGFKISTCSWPGLHRRERLVRPRVVSADYRCFAITNVIPWTIVVIAHSFTWKCSTRCDKACIVLW